MHAHTIDGKYHLEKNNGKLLFSTPQKEPKAGKKGLRGRKEDQKTVNEGEGKKKSLNVSVAKQ